MTYTVHPGTTRHMPDTAWHVTTAILAVVGIVAAAIGAWIAYGPDDGSLALFSWTWNVADISELWAPLLMIGGGVLTSLSMGVEAARDWEVENSRWLTGFEGLLAVAGLAAVVIGVILLF